jgi:hypothetical protein
MEELSSIKRASLRLGMVVKHFLLPYNEGRAKNFSLELQNLQNSITGHKSTARIMSYTTKVPKRKTTSIGIEISEFSRLYFTV